MTMLFSGYSMIEVVHFTPLGWLIGITYDIIIEILDSNHNKNNQSSNNKKPPK
jgi:hypothetical protein